MTGTQATAPGTAPAITRFRKKPVTVETLEWTGGNYAALRAFAGDAVRRAGAGLEVWNEQERDWIACPVGHRVVRGVLGEFYPVSPEAVARTYEPEDTATADVPAGELAAFGCLMERMQEDLAKLPAQIDAEVAAAVAAERGRILALAESRKTTLRWPENGPGQWGEIDVVPLAALRHLVTTCGQCDNGLVSAGGCTCGTGGGAHGHETLCGAEPCPNGCWDRLHAPAVELEPCGEHGGDGNG